jgi:16S rRNA (guanine527-N7)-methyltransferase
MGREEVAARFNVSRESLDRLEAHAELVRKWNRRINLIAPGTVEDIWGRHIADSLQLQHLIPATCTKIVDLGSGAGFPGLVLAIATGIETVLIESSTKKAAFLADVIRRTGAKARVMHGRIEELALHLRADVVTARALAPLPKLLELAYPLLAKGATGLFLKGQDVEAELTESTKYWKMQVQKHASVTDPRGTVLVLKEVERV